MLFALLPLLLLLQSAASLAAERDFRFDYTTRIGPVQQQGALHVYIPLAVHDGVQQVLDEQIDSDIPGVIEREPVYGNRYWHGSVNGPLDEAVSVRVSTTVRRLSALQAARPLPQPSAGEGEFSRYLRSNARVPVGHAILAPIRDEIRQRAGSDAPAAIARAIYDWVVDNVEYKKVGTGWGNGDTFWACSERYGNCTDFHALLISLARSEGIPARFEIGFPVPADQGAGRIAGYHCWVQLYLPELGWFSVDASEASKRPHQRDDYYGSQLADRIHFSSGRDLQLGAAHRASPLNYFVYPHIELDGAVYSGTVSRDFYFEAVDAPDGRALSHLASAAAVSEKQETVANE